MLLGREAGEVIIIAVKSGYPTVPVTHTIIRVVMYHLSRPFSPPTHLPTRRHIQGRISCGQPSESPSHDNQNKLSGVIHRNKLSIVHALRDGALLSIHKGVGLLNMHKGVGLLNMHKGVPLLLGMHFK